MESLATETARNCQNNYSLVKNFELFTIFINILIISLSINLYYYLLKLIEIMKYNVLLTLTSVSGIPYRQYKVNVQGLNKNKVNT